MSWQGQVNQPIGIAGIDSNGKIHALDASQLFNLNANNISSGTIAIARLPNGGVNGVSQLIQLNASGNFPTLNASALTNLSAANIVGTISTSNFSKATTSTVGVVQIGSNINISAGVISIPAATTSILGVGQPDGVTTTISGGLLVVSSVTSVSNLLGGSAGDILYQTAANTTGFLSASNGAVVGNAGTPSYTTTPTLTGTNFSGIPNSATTATSANTASAIVARDSNGDFSTHDFTVVGDLIGDMVNYNAYDPTIIAGSSTLGTNVSMIIATGSGGYSTTLPDADTFPVSQLGQSIYYVNNSSGINTVKSTTASSYINVPLSITGGTTTPPLYALDATSLPTVSNMTVAANVATATANNASAQTFDYVASDSVLSIAPNVEFINANVLDVDPSSTTGSTKFNYAVSNTVQVGSKLLVDVAGTVSEITVAAGTESVSPTPILSNIISHQIFKGDNNLLTLDGGTIYKSEDDGNIWVSSGSAPTNTTVLHFFDGNYYAGTSTGIIYSSSDLLSWNVLATISTSFNISHLANNGILLLSAGVQAGVAKVYSSPDGVTWTSRYSGSDAVCSFIFCVDRFVLTHGPVRHTIKISLDGITWSSLSSFGDGGCFSAIWTGTAYLANTYIPGVAWSTVWRSTDGNAWSQIFNTGYPGAFSFSADGLGNVLAVYWLQNSASSHISHNDGTSFTDVGIGAFNFTPFTFLGQNCVFQIPNNGNKIAIYDFITGNVTYSTITGYQFTMTSPSIAVPDWAGLGGQTEQYSVSTTSTPSFSAATTPTYTRSGDVITATYAQVTGTSGMHVQLKATTMNNGDILRQIGADLQVFSNIVVTIPPSGKYALTPTLTEGWQTLKFAG